MTGFALELLKRNKDRMDQVALVDRNGERKITWESLLDKICRVAAYAGKHGLTGVVPVCMERGMEVTATLLGLNLAGIGVAPFSITTPAGRLETVAGQVCNEVWTEETFKKACRCAPAYRYCKEGQEADPAYVVFTSGSTGTPKGVMLKNEAFLAAAGRIAGPDFLGLTENDRVMQSASLSFILSAHELFTSLYSGTPVYILPEESRGDTRMLEEFINRNGITAAFMPPQMYRNFAGGPSLRAVGLAGDRIMNLAPKGHRLLGFYGMTESAGIAFCCEIKKAEPFSPIGVPAADIRAYVLDENGKEAEEGELFLSGPVASGYYGQEEKSRQIFTPNPFTQDAGHRVLLHTGDLVRRLPSGEYLYLSRKDNMLKINGQRVEPGEIEAAMADWPGVDAAVCKSFTDGNQRSYLCAYYTCAGKTDEEKLRAYLEQKLPHYMVPAVFMKLDKMPLNANGKVDRKALPAPDFSALQSRYEAPEGEEEQRLCHAFEKALGLERVGRNDDFFRIGGDSIAALTVAAECGSLSVAAGDIFAGRTPAAIAVLAKRKENRVYENLPSDIGKAELTASQMGILLSCGMGEKCTKYNIPVHMSCRRPENFGAEEAKTAADRVLRAHPALYACITEESGAFFMERRPFPKEGLCLVREGTENEAAEETARTNLPLALGEDPLCTARILLTEEKIHVFMNMHHIVSDGSSAAVLKAQLEDAFSGKDIPAETVDAFAISAAEKRIRASREREEAETYFAHLLDGVETDSNLPADGRKADEKNPEASRLERVLPKDKIRAFLNGTGVTENTFFMGVFGYALAKMTGQNESLFGAAENGRGNALLGNTVSMLVKTLPVVMKIDEEENGKALLGRLQSQFFATMRNDCLGFSDLADIYGIRPDVMFVYQSDMLSGKGQENSMETEVLETGGAISSFSLMAFKCADSYRLYFDYRKDLYHEKTIRRFADFYIQAVQAFLSDAPLKEMVLIPEADREFLDRENRRNVRALTDETIIDLFLKSVRKYPDKTVITAGDRSYTYAESEDISNRICAYLKSRGIGRGSVVSILIPRCEYMLLASLGVMKAGAAYQPLDPAYPEERLKFMTEDAAASLIIKDRSLSRILADYGGPVLYTDEIETLPEAPAPTERPELSDTYILLYTSGTTGTPKGCMLSHGNLRAFAAAHVETLGLDETCVLASYASYGFDAHMADIYPAVTAGASLVVVPEEIRLDLPAIKEFCEENNVTHLLMTTQVARQFAVAFNEVKGLRMVDCGGEKLVSFRPSEKYRFLNLYGPTESTVCTTGFEVDKYYENIPIGRALLNSRLYVADSYGRRVPVGVPGELILCGPQVGKGYLGRPEQTEKVFVENTYEKAEGEYSRCYKTGDIVRFLEDGNVEFIGRRDHQIKIRGFRVELGEVEKAVRDYPGISDATVSVMDKNGAKSLCAYVVSETKVDIAELSRFIGESHPSYMIPAVIMQIDRIPLNVNGKVDKKKLPVPELQTEGACRKPENELQQKIYGCAAEAIGTEGFGTDTDLFSAGLSSIASIRLCTLLAEAFDIPVKIRDLKKCGTVLGLEAFVRRAKGQELPEEKNSAAESGGGTQAPCEYGPAVPVTKTMEGIFTECLQQPDSNVYNIPYLLRLDGAIDEKRLLSAVVKAVEAHPGMKTELFTDSEGRICQHRKLHDTFTEKDILRVDLAEGQEPEEVYIRPFSLTGGRLFEISLLHGDALYLFINIHHIISDGTSMGILLEDVEKAYAGEELQPENFTDFDVAEEEQRSRTEEELKEEKRYYEKLLEGCDVDFLPLADREAADGTATSGCLTAAGTHADAEKTAAYCKACGIGYNAFFLSVFGTVLAKYAGTDYSVFNTVYNGRNDSRTGRTSAMLVKTLPVVCRTDTETTEELARAMAGQLMDSMGNDLYSYAEISRDFGLKNDVMFIFQGERKEERTFCGRPAKEIPLHLSAVKAPLCLQVTVRDGKLFYELEYDPGRFTKELAAAFLGAFDQAAASFAGAKKMKEVSLLPEETEREMENYNRTEIPYDRTETVTGLFLKQAEKYPDALCVEYSGRKLTYAKAEELSAKLAGRLMREGIGAGDVVSVLINRDETMVTCALGVLRTGAAYVGLDPTYPEERLEFMLSDSNSKALIADRKLLGRVNGYGGPVIFTDEIGSFGLLPEEERNRLEAEKKHKVTPDSDALIIYSSGTTGVPKGSVLRHRNIVCFVCNYQRDQEIVPGARVATYASFGFDGGAMDVLGVPMSGASLYVIPDEIRLDLAALEQFYVKNRITAGFMTTQVGCMFIASTKCRSLKHFIVGGEKLIPVLGPEHTVFCNGYGPSETMCYVNHYRVRGTGKIQPVGRVSGNTKEYIIDCFGNRLPYGACGELCIAGGQVGRGYLGRPEKTAEVFVKNPFSADPEYGIMYRTGDVMRLLPDGCYDFVGRRDGQVKIRGFRVELGEIEQQIRKFPGITGAVVRALDLPAGGKYLAAYVVSGGAIDAEELKEFIGREKPDYMIPAAILPVPEIPLTSNGKVDFRKLPVPDAGAGRRGAEPENETEEKICGIFEEVLGGGRIYADDDFFKTGGSSILAIRVIVRCEQEGLPVVYKNLFANPTPRKLARFILGEKEADINAALLERGDGHDYSALSGNVPENLPEIERGDIGDVLLTGATGFLGSHIFRELMESASGKVICLVRSKDGLSAQLRFETIMAYYFDEWYTEEIRERTVIIDGELEEEGIREKLKSLHFDTVINCAANVKHFAVEEELMGANFSGVENLIRLAEEKKAELIQISSISVCGESVDGSVPADYIFKECDLNIGQSLENKYVYTKYLGEQAVIDAVSRKRIRGKVIRLGNLMARVEDSEFQVNAQSNGLLRIFLGAVKLGCFPVSLMDAKIEFSPIDCVAKAVVLLSGTPDKFTVFHARNCNEIHYSYLLQAVRNTGYPVETVEDDVFEERLKKALKNSAAAEDLGGLLAYRNSTSASMTEVTDHTGDAPAGLRNVRLKITASDAFTTKALYRLGFFWPLISEEYLKKMVEVLKELDFFER